MARLIHLYTYQQRRERLEPPAVPPRGDWDLVPVGIGLWIASVVRVLLGAVDGEVFRSEATLALACVVVIPFGLLGDGFRRDRRSHPFDGAPDPSAPPASLRVIPLPGAPARRRLASRSGPVRQRRKSRLDSKRGKAHESALKPPSL